MASKREGKQSQEGESSTGKRGSKKAILDKKTWRASIQKRTLIPMKVLDYEEPCFMPMIESMGWNRFVREYPSCSEMMVKEFYACYRWSDDQGSFPMWGRRIFCNPDVINELIGLDTTDGAEYLSPDDLATRFTNRELWNMIVHMDGMWPRSNDSTEATLFQPPEFKLLHFFARCYATFIDANVLPSSHTTTIARPRVEIIAAMLRGIRLNVGEFIFRRIHMIATRSLAQNMALPYPQLIGMICRRYGVADRGEAMFPMGPKITLTTVKYTLKDDAYFQRNNLPAPNVPMWHGNKVIRQAKKARIEEPLEEAQEDAQPRESHREVGQSSGAGPSRDDISSDTTLADLVAQFATLKEDITDEMADVHRAMRDYHEDASAVKYQMMQFMSEQRQWQVAYQETQRQWQTAYQETQRQWQVAYQEAQQQRQENFFTEVRTFFGMPQIIPPPTQHLPAMPAIPPPPAIPPQPATPRPESPDSSEHPPQ